MVTVAPSDPDAVNDHFETYTDRSWWLRVPFLSNKATPPTGSINDAPLFKDVNANWFSKITLQWIQPIVSLGYTRPLEPEDLWKLDDARGAEPYGQKILDAYEKRDKAANDYNARLNSGEISPPFYNRLIWSLSPRTKADKEAKWRESQRRQVNMLMVLIDVVRFRFYFALFVKILADTALFTTPLLIRELIRFTIKVLASKETGAPEPSENPAWGFAVGLFLMQLFSALTTQLFWYIAFTSSILLRGGLISAIFKRSLALSARARTTLPNGKLVTFIAADVTRVQIMIQLGLIVVSSPIQMVVCLVILWTNMGLSALAGYALFFLLFPPQFWIMGYLKKMRGQGVKWTEKRVSLIQEVLNNVKIIKFYAWEIPFLKRIAEARQNEIKFIRKLLLIRAGNSALAWALPALCTVIALVVYQLIHSEFDPAVIFTSVTLFQLLRLPLMLLPQGLNATVDGLQALGRLRAAFTAETISETKHVDPSLDVALRVQNASFVWDTPPPKGAKPTVAEKQADSETGFRVKDINMEIPRGRLVAIVGPVGSGKSSLVQGLIGDMKRTDGSVTFGGSVGYCSQSSWLQNASIKENITFGSAYDENKYRACVRASCLEPDLDMLPAGDATQVGEKGIQLSGGQKQRVSICRALYSNADIIFFDDPLSALDAQVGKSIFHDVLKRELDGKTRILVTHALHFLPHVDYIYTIENGAISEQGTYAELLYSQGSFSRLVKDLAHEEEAEEKEDDDEEKEKKKPAEQKKFAKAQQLEKAEDRATGAVAPWVYKAYFKAGNGAIFLIPFLIALAILQCVTVMASYWLIYWTENTFDKPEGLYMGVYAGWGSSQAIFLYTVSSLFTVFVYTASGNLHKSAVDRLLHAPMSYFDTTPLGRIMNRLSKDVDTIDNLMGESIVRLLTILAQLISGIILIAIPLHYFLIPGLVILVFFFWASLWYQPAARDLRRVDAILRSVLFAGFGESLSGLTTIRAYGETERFKKEVNRRIDVENRALWSFEAAQRWLGIRLDVLGTLLSLSVGLMVVGLRNSLTPAQAGLSLSYVLSIQQTLGFMVRQVVEVENNMNSVERVVYYANEIDQEAPHEIEEKKPEPKWPADGRVEFKDVVMGYRADLTPTLKGLSLSVGAGEKIGIVGRTGAGKSSIMVALYRIAELSSGSIVIDDVDVSKIGLADLRSKIAIIPQDPLLFKGTMRSNLDPFSEHDDKTLWDALKRSHLLVGSDDSSDFDEKHPVAEVKEHAPERFSLDSPIDADGSNLSVGQRSLVSLARALVKNSRIIVLDEATASVDYATDRKIQDTIASEFRDRTILCIAHRLVTIIGYHRICVMDNGKLAEFDTPSALYAKEDSIFRGMCDRSSITLKDIEFAQEAQRHYL